MVTTRAIHNQVVNVLDFLEDADLLYWRNHVSMDETGRISWSCRPSDEGFLTEKGHPGVPQYLAWINSGEYSAILWDGSLLQMTYVVDRGKIAHHRLMYMPCPFDLDPDLWVKSGENLGLADVVELYRSEDGLLRSPVRFDYDPDLAAEEHPAVHMTFNDHNCRIPCVAPISPLKFVDFVFRNFYRPYWAVQQDFFREAAWRHIGEPEFADSDRLRMHFSWNVRARASDYDEAY